MPGGVNVSLIGDSIRMFAAPYVRACLPPEYTLDSPASNSRSSAHVAAAIRDWVPPAAADIVHINCGLHDIRHDPGQNRAMHSPQEYVANLREVFSYLATTGARVIWATSTPVRHDPGIDTDRPRWPPSDLVEYNRLSAELALGFGFRINDLHRHLQEAPVAELWLPDGVHFNHAGNQLIGQQVAAAIRSLAPQREETSC